MISREPQRRDCREAAHELRHLGDTRCRIQRVRGRCQASVQHYDTDVLDAALLIMPLCKFTAPTGPR